MTNRNTTARSERQIFTLLVVLDHVQRDLESHESRSPGAQPHRFPRDLTGYRQVALQMRWRNRERTREVVEAAVRRLVAWQQRLHIHVEREQITNRIVVLGAIETVDR